MRDASIAVLREIGVDTGGSNVQFAIDPATGRMVVIEMNPRVSRSSALASKATGFPIAKVAAKLAVGYTLDEIQNDITGATPASFEPTIDYVVTKIPRFTFEKFPETEPLLTTADEVGGRGDGDGPDLQGIAAEGAARAGDRPVRPGRDRGAGHRPATIGRKEAILAALARPTPDRLRHDRPGLPRGADARRRSRVPAPTTPGSWRRSRTSSAPRRRSREDGLPDDRGGLHALKADGFSDRRLAKLTGLARGGGPRAGASSLGRPAGVQADRHLCRRVRGAHALPLQLLRDGHRRRPGRRVREPAVSDRRKVIILGGGPEPDRPGHRVRLLLRARRVRAARGRARDRSWSTAIPETVSTDPDTSDRLYFEPLTAEDVLEICRVEASRGELLGVIVQLGGQTPLKLSHALEKAGVPILGTSPDAIDLAEDRERFQQLLHRLGLQQPDNAICYGVADAVGEGRGAGLSAGDPALLRARRPGDAHRPRARRGARASWPTRRAPRTSGRS